MVERLLSRLRVLTRTLLFRSVRRGNGPDPDPPVSRGIDPARRAGEFPLW
jgi:hypothetical protein